MFTHSTTTNPSRIYINETGLYKISYGCVWKRDSSSTTRAIAENWIRKNGVTDIIPSKTSCYMRTSTNDANRCSNKGTLIANLNSGDYIELVGGLLQAEDSYGVETYNDCWIYVQQISNKVAQMYDSNGGDDYDGEITVSIDTVSYQDSDTFTPDTANYRMYVDKDGWYKIYYHVCSEDTGQNSRQTPQTYLRKNGVKLNPSDTYSYIRESGEADRNCEVGYLLMNLSAGDYIDIRHLKYQKEGSGTSVTLAQQSWILMEKIPTEDVAMVYESAGGQSVADGTTNAITFDTSYKVGPSFTHSASDSKIYINKTGWYEVSYSLSWEDDAGGDRYVGCASLRKNGVKITPSQQCDFTRGDTEALWHTVSGNTIIYLSDGDYIEFMKLMRKQGEAGNLSPELQKMIDALWKKHTI